MNDTDSFLGERYGTQLGETEEFEDVLTGDRREIGGKTRVKSL